MPNQHLRAYMPIFLWSLHVYDPSIGEAGTGRWLQLGGQSDLHSQFQASQSYIARPYLNQQMGAGGKQKSKPKFNFLLVQDPLSNFPSSNISKFNISTQ